MIIGDTGVLVAAAIRTDKHHASCVELIGKARKEKEVIIIPATILAESGYLIEKFGGALVEADFVETCARPPFSVIGISSADLVRMAALIREYADLPLGVADASVVAIAERLGIRKIATLDHKHFNIVRPNHAEYFSLLP